MCPPLARTQSGLLALVWTVNVPSLSSLTALLHLPGYALILCSLTGRGRLTNRQNFPPEGALPLILLAIWGAICGARVVPLMAKVGGRAHLCILAKVAPKGDTMSLEPMRIGVNLAEGRRDWRGRGPRTRGNSRGTICLAHLLLLIIFLHPCNTPQLPSVLSLHLHSRRLL